MEDCRAAPGNADAIDPVRQSGSAGHRRDTTAVFNGPRRAPPTVIPPPSTAARAIPAKPMPPAPAPPRPGAPDRRPGGSVRYAPNPSRRNWNRIFVYAGRERTTVTLCSGNPMPAEASLQGTNGISSDPLGAEWVETTGRASPLRDNRAGRGRESGQEASSMPGIHPPAQPDLPAAGSQPNADLPESDGTARAACCGPAGIRNSGGAPGHPITRKLLVINSAFL